MSPPAPSPTPGLQRAPLDVYRKITVIRDKTDSVTFEDSSGEVQTVQDLGEEAFSAVSFGIFNLFTRFKKKRMFFNTSME